MLPNMVGTQRDASPTSSSFGDELCSTGQHQIEEVASILSQMGTSPKMPYRLTLPSMHSLSLEHQWAHSVTPHNWTHYCVHVRVTQGVGRGNQPLPFHTWNGLLIANILQEACNTDCITKDAVLAPGEAILFLEGP